MGEKKKKKEKKDKEKEKEKKEKATVRSAPDGSDKKKIQRKDAQSKPKRRGLQANLVNSTELCLDVSCQGCPCGVVREKGTEEGMVGPSIQRPIPMYGS